MLNKDLHKLAKALSLTEAGEPEPYILTPEEEQEAIANEIERAQKFMAYKMARVLKTQDEIWHKISLTDWNEKIDRPKVLALANMAKNRELWERKQREAEKSRETDQLKELQEYWTYRRVYQLMKYNSLHRFGKEFDETAENIPVIKALCFFIARHDRFATELGYDRLRGLLIRGNSGTGKTHLVRCTEDNGLNPVLTISMIDITERIKEEGKYSIPSQGQKILYLDDVGTEEPVVNHFGTKITWFKNFIEKASLKTKCYNHLIITTNLNFKGMEEQYGYRVASRMREMFNVIDLTGKDRRR
jgi:DNA replication protein DnaC